MSKYIKKEIVFGKCHLEDEKHVILCGDKEYIQYCGITLSSVILSNPNMNFVFNIFCDDVSDNDLEKLRETSEKFNTKIVVYYLNLTYVNNLINSLNGDKSNISVATFFRLISFEVLKGYTTKALYLDSDMMVTGAISYLWNYDMLDSYAMVVECPVNIEHLQRIGVERYFNAGMVFCNIEKWNYDNLTDCCLDYVLREKPEWMDQDALNKVFKGNCIYLDDKWNFLADLETVINNDGKPSLSTFVSERKDLKIIHFVGRNKPWCHWVQYIPITKNI